MDTYYLHDYDIDGSGVQLVYLRKTDGIDPQTKTDALDCYLKEMILLQFPNATDTIEDILGAQDIQKWDAMLLENWHLTANYRCATFVNCGTMITINYASVLVPFNVLKAKYELIGRHSSMYYDDYNRICLRNPQNPPLLLHQHPLIHGIECYREFQVYPNLKPENIYFMYHHGEDRIRAVVNIIDNTVSFSYSSNPHEIEVIMQDLYEMKNGKLMSLKLNYEKTLFQTAKQMLMKELANKTNPIDKDFEYYLHYADEL